MIIQPKIRGFICTTAHPVGCEQAIQQQINYVKSQNKINGPQHALIIGASTGYGLASRIVATFAAGAKTLGVFFEKEADEKRTASPGWYNTAAFEKLATQENYYAKSINGDAFSQAIKKHAADIIREDFGKVDLIIYSLASPRRIHPITGQVFSSALKPIGQSFTNKTIDAFRSEVKDIRLDPASDEEITNTIAVMGGEDWQMWLDFLGQENLLANKVMTVAYSYIGPPITYPIYKDGTIGKAKNHLKMTAEKLDKQLRPLQGRAFIAVNKAVVTQASAAIPVVPLYISLLFKIMKAKGTHEGCIEQMYRLFKDHLYAIHPPTQDNERYIRLYNFEMQTDIQQQITALWPQVTPENLAQIADLQGYCDDFYQLFGFNLPSVNYQTEVDPIVNIPSIDLQKNNKDEKI